MDICPKYTVYQVGYVQNHTLNKTEELEIFYTFLN